MGQEWFKNQNASAYYRFLGVHNFPWVCICEENIAHQVQLNKPIYKYIEFYFLNKV
jgi:hypothetical protein